MNKAKLGKRIKNCRLRLGKNQEEFGEMFEPAAPKSAVSRWEHGENAPNKKRLKKIAKLCDTTVQELVGSGPMLTEKQKNCPYCHPGSKINGIEAWYDGELALGEVLDAGDYIELYFNPVNQYLDAEGEDSLFAGVKFCPWCGRSLNEEADND